MPSVDPRRATIALTVFLLVLVGFGIYLGLHEFGKDGQSTGKALIAFIQVMGSLTVFAAGTIVAVLEGGAMLAELLLRAREKKGREEGRRQGREEGQKEEYRRWVDWDERRRAAEQAGTEFTEPSPAARHLSRRGTEADAPPG